MQTLLAWMAEKPLTYLQSILEEPWVENQRVFEEDFFTPKGSMQAVVYLNPKENDSKEIPQRAANESV